MAIRKTVGKRLQERCRRPSGQSRRGPTAPRRGRASAKRTSSSIAPGRTNASLFRSSSQRPLATAAPRLLPAPKPTFSVRATSRTSGCSAASHAAVPSCEAWSTTIVSTVARRCPSAASAARQRASSVAALVAHDHDRDVGHARSAPRLARPPAPRPRRRSGRRRRSSRTASSGRRRWRSAWPPAPRVSPMRERRASRRPRASPRRSARARRAGSRPAAARPRPGTPRTRRRPTRPVSSSSAM